MINLYGTHQTAEVLEVSRRDVVRLVERGDLTPVGKLPGTTGAYLFDPADVEALAATRTPQEASA